MNCWRVVLVLLLALLLPWRGGAAALLHCLEHPPTATSSSQHGSGYDTHRQHSAAPADAPVLSMSEHASADKAVPHSPACDAQTHGCCVSVGVVGSAPTLAPWALGLAHFPPLLLPALTFEWPAQERPPRYL